MMYICAKCRKELPRDQFGKGHKRGIKPVSSWCYPCYRQYDIARARRKGVKPKVEISLYDRFMSKVEKTSSCWIFHSAVNNSGYSSMVITESRGHKKTHMAHRISWELFNDLIPEGLCVLHKCDNRVCVNPEHLFLGTHKDNTQDAISKGRWIIPPRSTGIDNPISKLTFDEVQQIRSLYVKGNQLVLAKQFGVSQSTVSNIICGTHWAFR